MGIGPCLHPDFSVFSGKRHEKSTIEGKRARMATNVEAYSVIEPVHRRAAAALLWAWLLPRRISQPRSRDFCPLVGSDYLSIGAYDETQCMHCA